MKMIIPEKISSTENIAIFGKTGTGKTTLAKLLIEEIKKPKTHSLFIFDVNDEYTGDYIINDKEEYYAYYDDDENHFKKGKVYVFKFPKNLSEYEEIITDINQELTHIYLIIDECNLFTQPTYIQDDLKNFIALHRHKKDDKNIFYGSNYMVIARRPAEISRYTTAQVHRVFTFRITELRDLNYLKDIGLNPEQVKNLKNPEYSNNKLINLDYLENE